MSQGLMAGALEGPCGKSVWGVKKVNFAPRELISHECSFLWFSVTTEASVPRGCLAIWRQFWVSHLVSPLPLAPAKQLPPAHRTARVSLVCEAP